MGSIAAPSALQTLLNTSSLSSSSTTNTSTDHHRLLALQIAHNLRHQHSWTSLRLHTHSPLTSAPLPRPLLSGRPPRRLYTHPDEQIDLLRSEDTAPVAVEREWVLPSHLRERWSLARFGEVFDGVGRVPRARDGEGIWAGEDDEDGEQRERERREGEEEEEEVVGEWRKKLPKRILLATLDDDSTVVYYIVHDGMVKPRQN